MRSLFLPLYLQWTFSVWKFMSFRKIFLNHFIDYILFHIYSILSEITIFGYWNNFFDSLTFKNLWKCLNEIFNFCCHIFNFHKWCVCVCSNCSFLTAFYLVSWVYYLLLFLKMLIFGYVCCFISPGWSLTHMTYIVLFACFGLLLLCSRLSSDVKQFLSMILESGVFDWIWDLL